MSSVPLQFESPISSRAAYIAENWRQEQTNASAEVYTNGEPPFIDDNDCADTWTINVCSCLFLTVFAVIILSYTVVLISVRGFDVVIHSIAESIENIIDEGGVLLVIILLMILVILAMFIFTQIADRSVPHEQEHHQDLQPQLADGSQEPSNSEVEIMIYEPSAHLYETVNQATISPVDQPIDLPVNHESLGSNACSLSSVTTIGEATSNKEDVCLETI
jgi:uncharacterized integral membrane protein